MATFTHIMSGDNRYSIELEVKEKSTDISANTSVVSYTFKAIKSSGGGYYTANKNNPVKVSLDGTEIVNKKVAYDFSANATITLASGTKTITHNADGTKTIACSGYFKDANNSLGSATASGSLTLTALHTPPTPRIDSITETNSNLSNYGIANLDNTFVAYLSKKQFAVSSRLATPDDYITSYTIKNGNVSSTSSTSPIELDFKNQPITFGQPGYVQIDLSATDEMNSTGTISVLYSHYILYTPATIVNSNFTTKRVGQLTGDIELIANGTYYNGSVGNQAVSPKVYYRYRQRTTPESSYSNWIQITSGIQTNLYNWEVSKTLSGFNPQNSYDIELKVTDNVAEDNDLTYATASSIVLLGEASWTEFKDRVDFKQITIQNVNPFEISTGNLTITKTSGNSTADGTYAKYGNIVMINVHISTTGTTASGSNIFVGSISTFSPVINTSIVGYASAKPIIASFGTTGGITIRNASPEVVGNNSSINIRGTFIVE